MIKYSIILSAFFALLFSCNWNKNTDIEPIKIVRFDADLLAFDTTKFEESEVKMLRQYGVIFPFYIEQLMGIGNQSDPKDPYYYKAFFPKFLSGEYRSMMDSCQRIVIKDIDQFESELTEAYSNLKGQFSEKKPSKIYSFFISPMGSNPQAAFSYGNDTIGINWFNYLGKNFSLYQSVYHGYNYMIEWNQPQYLTRNVMLVEYNLLNEKYSPKEENSELIYKMIDAGKKFHYLDIVMPKLSDETKIGYNESQMKWCKENEFEIWSYFMENKLLYSLDVMDSKRYTEEGPNTNGMPPDAPGMVGAWIGWQIVKTYADKSGKSLLEVMKSSPKEIFKIAGYKPKK